MFFAKVIKDLILSIFIMNVQDINNLNLNDYDLDTPTLSSSKLTYFSKLQNQDYESLYFQLPKCKVVSNNLGKFSFNIIEDVGVVRKAFGYIKDKIIDLINDKKTSWFSSELSKTDIQKMTNNIMSMSSKVVHCNKFSEIKFYDENGNQTIKKTFDKYGRDNTIQPNDLVIPLINVKGISFNSIEFIIHIGVIQIMKLDDILNFKINESTIKKNDTVECLIKNEPNLKYTKDLEKVNINLNNIGEGEDNDESEISLKNPEEIYYEIYAAAKDKAKHIRKLAIEAFLEAKEIKTKYMLDDLDEDDESDFEDL